MAKEDFYLQSPDQGEKFQIAGGDYRVIISGRETGGAFAVIEMKVPPGGGPGAHAHPDFQESFFVQEGEVQLHNEHGVITATTGSFASIPRGGMIHSFKNVSDRSAVLICTVVPAGLEDFFREVSELARAGKPDPKDIEKIAGKYGQTIYPPDYWDK